LPIYSSIKIKIPLPCGEGFVLVDSALNFILIVLSYLTVFEIKGVDVKKKYWNIFIRFFRVGALTFGGGLAMLPIIQHELSEGEHQYLTKEQIIDNYALAQCAPGIIAVNTSILSGYQMGGVGGGIAAAFGVTMPSFLIITVISAVLSRFTDNVYVSTALMGVRSGVCALILRTLTGLAKKNIVDKITLIIFFLAFALLLFTPVSPVVPIVVGAVLGILAKKAVKFK
jgi:chromate transporter